jgi:Family of unknown function (DUF6768)
MTTVNDDSEAEARSENRSMTLPPAVEEGIFEQVAATFRSRRRAWVALMWLLTALWAAVGLWAALSFYRVQTVRDWIMYATLFLLSAMAITMLKIWYWMELNRHTQTREIKRLELQVARMAAKIPGPSTGIGTIRPPTQVT